MDQRDRQTIDGFALDGLSLVFLDDGGDLRVVLVYEDVLCAVAGSRNDASMVLRHS
jgi:hypothetical protein